jgi:hypothetical protein
MLIAFWTHHLSPFLGPHWGNVGIRYYGLGYVLGFVTAGWLLARYARDGRSQLPAAKIGDLMMALVIGVMLGGRLGSFLLYHPEQLLRDPLSFFRVWEGGMASHGGFIGVAIALVWFARAEGIPFRHLGDLVTSVAPPGLFFVRIANFINGELWGRPSRVPWAVIFPEAPTRAHRNIWCCRGTHPSFTRPPSRACSCWRICSGGSGARTWCGNTREGSAGNFWSPTRSCGPSVRPSASPTPRLSSASAAAPSTRFLWSPPACS